MIALFDTAWELAAGGAVMAAAGAALLKADPGSLPVEVQTLGDLVTRAVPLNAHKLAEMGARLPDPWTMLTVLAAEHWTCNGFAPVTDLIMPPLLRTPAG